VNTLRPLYGDLTQLRYTPEFFAYKTTLYSAEVNYEQPYGSFLSASSFNAIHPTLATDLTPYYTGLDGIGPSAPASGVGHHDDQQETEELRFTSNRLGNFEFLTGLFFQHESLTDGTNYVSFEPGGLVPNSSVPLLGYGDRGGTLNEYAGFFNTTYYIVPTLDVTFGYRYSDIRQNRVSWDGGVLYEGNNTTVETFQQSSSQSSDTYMAGARWHITDGVMVYLRAASGYRPGGVRTPLPGAPPDFGNVYYSDNIWSYETGLKVTALDGRLTVDTDLFWINWDNIQALVTIGQFNTDGNGGHALSRGVETQATYVPVNGVTLRGNFSYTDAFFKYADPSVLVTSPGQRLFFVPELQGSLSADYSWSMGKFKANAGGDWSYTGDQYDITNFLLPSFSVVNAHAGLKWNNETLNIFVRNLTDKRAIVGDTGYYPTFYSLYTVTVNQPRTVGISFSQHF
jgi:iron complex outermembrane receptor protein